MNALAAFCPVPRPDASLEFLLLGASILFTVAIVVTRRLPLVVGIASLAAVGGVLFLLRLPVREAGIASAALAGALTVGLAPLPILIWAVLRPFYWLPATLVESTDSPDLLRLMDCPFRNRRIAELGRLGFRHEGTLFVEASLERQLVDVFLDPTATILACATRHKFGFKPLSFLSMEDGILVRTSNSNFIPTWPLRSGTVAFLHQFCPDPEELLRNHRRNLAGLTMERPAAWGAEGPLTEVRRLYEADMDDAVRRGRLVLRRRGRLAMTLKAWVCLSATVMFRDYRRACRKIEA